MTHAIRIHSYGGPEVLRWETVDVPEPGQGQARVRHTTIGLNFIDTYERTGLYPLQLPAAAVISCLVALPQPDPTPPAPPDWSSNAPHHLRCAAPRVARC